MSPGHRGRRAWEVSILLVLAVVIVSAIAFNLANLEPLNESVPAAPPPSSRQPPDPSSLGQIFFAVSWATAVVLLALIVFLLLGRRPKAGSWGSLLPPVVGILLFIVLLNSIPTSLPSPKNETASEDGTGGIALPSENSPPVFPSLAGGILSGLSEAFLLLAVFGAIAWIVLVVRSPRGPAVDPSHPIPAATDPRGSARETVQETIRDLEIGADVRATILACFQRFCGLLRSRGIADQEAFTAREIEGLAVRTFSLSREASASLTSLFEEARYSVHPLGEAERERALASLARIRVALEA